VRALGRFNYQNVYGVKRAKARAPFFKLGHCFLLNRLTLKSFLISVSKIARHFCHRKIGAKSAGTKNLIIKFDANWCHQNPKSGRGVSGAWF
jgi:hypothetical protein